MKKQCSTGLSEKCTHTAKATMDYKVHLSCCNVESLGTYLLTGEDGNKICRTKVSVCDFCGRELEKKLSLDNLSSLIVESLS